jgi:hypothetical protein
MLVIRKRQMAVFEQVEIKKFVDCMVIHLKKFFPKQCEALGEPGLRETVQHGIKRAKAYGITSKRDVYKYVDLMVVFGRDFDTDKRYPWAGEILQKQLGPGVRIEALHQAARKQLRRS